MRGLEMHRDRVGLEYAHKGVGDFLPDSLLNRKASCEDSNETRQLGDANDVLMRYLTDVSVTVKGKGVMLA